MTVRLNQLFYAAAALLAATTPGLAGVNVVTYHYDNLRTGWNQNETTLTAANVGSGSFGLQQQVALDEQVDAQPLFISGQTIAGQGTHDVVYVATENNTIYAIDANSGSVLLSVSVIALSELDRSSGVRSAPTAAAVSLTWKATTWELACIAAAAATGTPLTCSV